MAFDSAAAIDAALTAYHANVTYRSSNSAVMALAFAEACEVLIGLLPAMADHANSARVSFSHEFLEKRLNAALEYAAAAGVGTSAGAGGGGGVVRYPDFTERGD